LPWGFALSLRASAQGAVEPLINNEQFYVGGVNSVRGYLVAEELGDSGASGTVEMQFPNLFGRSGHAAQWRLIPEAFVDAGVVRVLQPLAGEHSFIDIRSAGVGVEFGLYKWISGYLYWADPLVTAANTRAYESRWEFSVRSVW
jgi:hemolysin activation/secretion protein